MASLSFDGQSFIIDGRRIWLVAAGIDYALLHPNDWPERLRTIARAGFNCILAHCHWQRHEPERGDFRFTDETDLRRFVTLAGEEGLHVVLRPGPFVGRGLYQGGMPAWLNDVPGLRRRELSEPFLECVSRYLSMVMDQVRDLQATQSVSPGAATRPLLMVQAEHRWHCHHRDHSPRYLDEIARYLREAGCQVPIVGCNHFWQPMDEVIEVWDGWDHLASDLRQLRLVQPGAPLLAMDVQPTSGGPMDVGSGPGPGHWLGKLCSVLAAGAQFGISGFQAPYRTGAAIGRTAGRDGHCLPAEGGPFAGLDVVGGPTEAFAAIRRAAILASSFGHVFAHADGGDLRTTIASDSAQAPVGVTELRGPQGFFVFIQRGTDERRRQVDLMLPEGLTITVPLGEESAVWIGGGINLGGYGELSYTNLSPWTMLGGGTLVLFGPAGSDGLVSIDQTDYLIRVPGKSEEPVRLKAGGVQLLVLSTAQVDQSLLDGRSGIWIGCRGLDDQGRPVREAGRAGRVWHLDSTAELTSHQPVSVRPSGPAPKLSWEYAGCGPWLGGEEPSAEYADPQHSPRPGYAWIKATFPRAIKGRLMRPWRGDRLTLFSGGKRMMTLGAGEGADADPVAVTIKGDIHGLLEVIGPAADDWSLNHHGCDESGDLHLVKPIRTGKSTVEAAGDFDPFAIQGFWPGLREGVRPHGPMLRLMFNCRTGSPAILELDEIPHRLLIAINDRPLACVDPELTPAFLRWVIPADWLLGRKANSLQLVAFSAEIGRADVAGLSKKVKLWQSDRRLGHPHQWSRAQWRCPPIEQCVPPASQTARDGLPCWWRTSFSTTVSDRPMSLSLEGLARGAVWLSGRVLCRYGQAHQTADRSAQPDAATLPASWLLSDQANELHVFDEHGRRPVDGALKRPC
ncbi:MAG: beta-galactosidase [Phycisphaeraceae bacterium]|nr:beta-galactosidase [Phycisphaeraceae bacterium]